MSFTASTSRTVAGISTPVPLVGSTAARGALWTIVFSVLNKGATLGSQVALAWFLFPEEFGQVAMALSVTSFAVLMAGTNFRNVLIQRREQFAQDAGQVFWLSLVLNLATALVLGTCATLAANAFHEPKVASLIRVAIVAVPIQALSTIYAAALYRDLRFRRMATIHLVAGILQSVSAILLAWQGFGAYALILPLVVTASVLAILYRVSAGRILLPRPRPFLWPALLASTGWLMVNSLFLVIQTGGPNFVIGLAHEARVIGFYYWGFAVSSQAIYLLSTNLQNVLFPVLSRLNDDPSRQFEAVRKACQTLMVVAVPACVLQALLARPLIEFLFHDRWLPAVPVVQWLSLGILTQPLGILAAAVLMARGRFRLLAGTTAMLAVTVTLAAAMGASQGQQESIARWAAGALLLANVAAGWIAYREFQRGWRALAGTLATPLSLGLPVAGIGWCVAGLTAGYGALCEMVCVTISCLALYAALLKLVLPEAMAMILARLKSRPLEKSSQTKEVLHA